MTATPIVDGCSPVRAIEFGDCITRIDLGGDRREAPARGFGETDSRRPHVSPTGKAIERYSV